MSLRPVHFYRGGLSRVQAVVVVIVVAVIRFVDALHRSFPEDISAKRAVVADAPGEDLAVVGKCDNMHATGHNLGRTNILCAEVGVETWALDINRGFGGAEAEFARAAFAKDVDIEALSGGLVDDGA